MQPKVIALIAAFAATVPLAHWMTGNIGTACVTDGPCLLPVGFGWAPLVALLPSAHRLSCAMPFMRLVAQRLPLSPLPSAASCQPCLLRRRSFSHPCSPG